MLELLPPHRRADDLLQLVVTGARAQRPPQVGLVQREQRRAEPAVGGQADAIAVTAERLRRRAARAGRRSSPSGSASTKPAPRMGTTRGSNYVDYVANRNAV